VGPTGLPLALTEVVRPPALLLTTGTAPLRQIRLIGIVDKTGQIVVASALPLIEVNPQPVQIVEAGIIGIHIPAMTVPIHPMTTTLVDILMTRRLAIHTTGTRIVATVTTTEILISEVVRITDTATIITGTKIPTITITATMAMVTVLTMIGFITGVTTIVDFIPRVSSQRSFSERLLVPALIIITTIPVATLGPLAPNLM
jgi:hypothetical protein